MGLNFQMTWPEFNSLIVNKQKDKNMYVKWERNLTVPNSGL